MQPEADIEEQNSNLLRNFILVGLGSIILVIFVLSTLIHRHAVDSLIHMGESKNIAFARLLYKNVWQQHADEYLKYSSDQLARILRTDVYKEVNQRMQEDLKGASLLKIKIYDQQAITIYSTEPSQIGKKKTDSVPMERALTGEVVSRLAFRDRMYAQEELLSNKNIISSYIHMSQVVPEDPSATGVIEIYSDVSALYKDVISTRNNVILIISMAMLLLFAILFLFIRRACEITGWHLQEKQKSDERIRHIAYHDPLTGLPNREMFRMQLESAAARAERTDRLMAVLFLDIDRFKTINDSLGHDAGDEMLKEVAERLLSCVRVTDTVSRLGGDEFTIILDSVTHVDEVEEVASRILSSMSKPFMIDDQQVRNTISIGISIYPLDEKNLDHMISNADAAMYEAKASGKDGYLFYNSGMNESNGEKLEMERKLRTALEDNEYLLQFQPIVDLSKGNMVGVEALLRWSNEEYGIVSPDRFIPILEETGFISIVGDWVLMTACKKAMEWQNMGYEPITMAVNISIIQFRRLEFIESIQRALQESGLDPKYLKLEITESTLMDQSDACLQKLNAIREIGVSIAADDFGTGYSSLSYLKKLPIDILKIDRSFITDLDKSSDSAAIVTAIAALAHSLKLNVVAEGVERVEELNFLAALSCNYIQGYIFSKPVVEDDLLRIMDDKHFFLDKLDAAREKNLAASG